MSFNPELNYAQKVVFSWKMTNFHSQICFNIYYLQKFHLNEKLNLYYQFILFIYISKSMQGTN